MKTSANDVITPYYLKVLLEESLLVSLGVAKTTLLINLLLRPCWLDYNNINIFGKSLFQPEYHILKKAFEEKLPKEVIIRLLENENEITDLSISPILIVEETAKDIRDKSDIVCNFYQSTEHVPDPTE